jgi:putative thioredoxin
MGTSLTTSITAGNPVGTIVEVNQDNFVTEVLERSQRQLVVVDFYATWCGPCQLLKPILEKLTQEYAFTLAKIDIDASPLLASQYQVNGVPDVRLGWQGTLQQGFVGVIPEPKIRELLTQFGLQSQLEQTLALIQTEQAAGQTESVKQRFSQLIQTYPDRPQVIMAAATFLVQIGSFESAQKLLAAVPITDRITYTQAEHIRALIGLKQQVGDLSQATPLDQDYASAIHQLCAGQYQPALEALLQMVSEHRQYNNDAARKAMLVIFGVLGDDHALTKTYRKRLSLAL